MPRCDYWNYSLNEGRYSNDAFVIIWNPLLETFRGDWDTKGVTVIRNNREDSTIICNSTHLTSFAVLVDVSDGHEVSY